MESMERCTKQSSMLNETLVCEIDETCDISTLNIRPAQAQEFSAEKVNDSLVEKQSLKEF